jgi:Cu(I)/Ag(I) efflux system membrane protein CusA/SilA
MPPLDEGDLLYMPSGAARACRPARRPNCCSRPIADQDRARGRAACSARPAAPKPRPIRRRWRCSRPRSSSSRASQWRPGMTPDKLVDELDRIVQGAGPVEHLGAADPQPHRHAGDRHQEPGRRQGAGADLAVDRPRHAAKSRGRQRTVPGRELGAGRAAHRRPLRRRRIRPRRAARYGLNIADVQSVIATGDRWRQHRRDGRRPAALSDQPALSARSARQRRLESCAYCRSSPDAARSLCSGDVADIRITDGPPMLRARTRAVGLGLRRHPRVATWLGRADMQQRGRQSR